MIFNPNLLSRTSSLKKKHFSVGIFGFTCAKLNQSKNNSITKLSIHLSISYCKVNLIEKGKLWSQLPSGYSMKTICKKKLNGNNRFLIRTQLLSSSCRKIITSRDKKTRNNKQKQTKATLPPPFISIHLISIAHFFSSLLLVFSIRMRYVSYTFLADSAAAHLAIATNDRSDPLLLHYWLRFQFDFHFLLFAAS